MPRLNVRDDRGSISTVALLLMALGVLLGMTALVIDVGRLYVEREELQAGADAAAMTVALDCAKRRLACTTSSLANAEEAADANAADGRANVEQLCGWARRVTLPVCTSSGAGELADCLGSPDRGVNFVQVRTRTEVASNDYVLPYAFAQTMTGVGDGATVGACARVAWGPPSAGLALAISACEYQRTRHDIVTAPPWPPNPAWHREVALGIHAGTATHCSVGPPPGWSLPRGFGWLDEDGSECHFTLEADLTYAGDLGASVSPDCRQELRRLRDTHQVVAMPIYDGERGHGPNGQYHLYKLAAFVVTGYALPGLSEHSNVNPSFDPCTGSDTCVYGYFVDVDFLPGQVGPDPGADLGLMAVKTIG